MSSSRTSSSSSETVAAACSSRRSSESATGYSSPPVSGGRLRYRQGDDVVGQLTIEVVERQVFLVAAELEQPFHYIVAVLVFNAHASIYR
jgi:hypothetical protein